ncbi:MAG: hypothetical protein Tsb0020_27700 [Haliangiales bacterium]
MKLKKLIKELKRKLGGDRDNIALWVELAALYRDSGNIDDAVVAYREVALACRDSGRLDEAIAACRSALELRPEETELREVLFEMRRAQRAAQQRKSTQSGSQPRRRAQFWPSQTQEREAVAAAGDPAAAQRAPSSAGGEPGRAQTSGASGAPGAPRRPTYRGSAVPELREPRQATPVPVASPAGLARAASEQDGFENSSQFNVPTPLPAPLALHEAVEDSLAGQQPLKLKQRTSDVVPSISLPSELEASEDDLFDVAVTSPSGIERAVSHHDAGAEAPLELDDEPEELLVVEADGELGDDEETTDVRGLLPARDTVLDGKHTLDELALMTARRGVDSVGEQETVESSPILTTAHAVAGERRSSGAAPEADPRGARQLDDRDPDSDSDEDDDYDNPTLIKEQPSHASIPLPPPTGDADFVDDYAAVPSLAPSDDALAETSRVVVPVVEEATEATEERDSTQLSRATEPDLVRPAGVMTSAVESSVVDPERISLLAAQLEMLPSETITELAPQLVERELGEGEYVFGEGEPSSACFLIAGGQVRVLQRGPGGDHRAPLQEVRRLEVGALFGELALLPARRRRGAAQATVDSRLYELPRARLRELAASYAEVGPMLDALYRARLVTAMLENSPLLRSLPVKQRASLSSRFRRMRRESGDEIISQGARTGGLYLVMQGSIEVTQRVAHHRHTLLATLGEGAYVGDMSLLDDGQVSDATVIATGPVELATLPPVDFLSIARANVAIWSALKQRAEPGALAAGTLLIGDTGLL